MRVNLLIPRFEEVQGVKARRWWQHQCRRTISNKEQDSLSLLDVLVVIITTIYYNNNNSYTI